jgi:hypothetical protein
VPRVCCVISGDFHGHRQDAFKGADGRTILAVSPGSQAMQDISEDAAKYFYAMRADLSFESIPLRSRKREWFTFRNPTVFEHDLAGVVADVEDQQAVPAEIARPIVVAEFSDAIPEARDRLLAALSPKCHLFLRPLAAARAEGRVSPAPETMGLAARLADRYRDRPALYAWAKALLEAEDPKATLIRLMDEFLGPAEKAEKPQGQLGVD